MKLREMIMRGQELIDEHPELADIDVYLPSHELDFEGLPELGNMVVLESAASKGGKYLFMLRKKGTGRR